MKINKIQEWGAAVALLLFSLASALHTRNPVMGMQDTNWYFNYDMGYNHRGLMGSIFRFFYGQPVYEVVQANVPIWDYYAEILIIICVWGLLMFPIVRNNYSQSKKIFLFSCASVLLLAPVWREVTTLVGLMDKFVFLMVIGALIGLVLRKPLLFTLFMLVGFLIHPVMLFYALLFVVAILYGLLNFSQMRRCYKWWATAAIFPLLFSLFLYFINNPEYNLLTLEKYNYHDKDILVWLRGDFLQPGEHNLNIIYGRFLAFPKFYGLLFIYFGILPLLFTSLIIYLARKNNLFLSGQYPQHPLFKNKFIQLLIKIDIYLLLLATIFVVYPSLLVIVDAQRVLYWSQWNAMLVFIYLLWNDRPIGEMKPAKKNKKQVKQFALKYVSPILLVSAYAFGGAPYVQIPIALPLIFQCKQFCIPLLTDKNPLGNLYSQFIYSTVKSTLFPLEMSGKTMRYYNWSYLHDYDLKDDVLVVPDTISGKFFVASVQLEKGETIKVRVLHQSENETVPSLQLLLFGRHEAALVSATSKETIWRVTASATAHWDFQLNTSGGTTFEIEQFIIEHSN